MDNFAPKPSLATIKESELITQLLAAPHWRERVLGIHGIPRSVQHFLEVDHRKLGKSGDVDILVVDPNTPHFATAIQAKRIRVHEKSFEPNGKPNKLSELPKLVEQTNRLVDLGFWQVFAFIVIAVDSRVRNSGRYQFDGLTHALRKQIDDHTQLEKLAPEAGCIVFEITQPMEDAPLSIGTYSAHVMRMPTNSIQNSRVTKWVTENTQNKFVAD